MSVTPKQLLGQTREITCTKCGNNVQYKFTGDDNKSKCLTCGALFDFNPIFTDFKKIDDAVSNMLREVRKIGK